MKRLLARLAVLLLAGCALQGGPRQPERFFILEAPAGKAAASPVELPPTSSASFYDTQEIAYSREPGTRAFYQFNRWTERPQRVVHAALASRFPESPQSGKRILTTHLDEFYHDAAQRPGTAHITLTAQLVDAASRKVLGRRVFTASAPAASYDAPGAVRGFDAALGSLLDQVVSWVDARSQ